MSLNEKIKVNKISNYLPLNKSMIHPESLLLKENTFTETKLHRIETLRPN